MPTTPDDAGQGRALQDIFQVRCFGCGALNDHGLKIKSRWLGEELVCSWQPQPFHIGHPGVVYGGIIASVIDCHSIWTAMADWGRENGHDYESGPPPFGFVTGKLSINYLKAADVARPLELKARVVDRGERRISVHTRVFQGELECANADVIAVRVPMPA